MDWEKEADTGRFERTFRSIRKTMWIIGSFVIIEFLGAKLSNSLALLADAVHMGTDLLSLSLSLMAAWIGSRSTRRRQWRRAKQAEALGSLIGTVLILGVTAGMVHEAWERFESPEEVRSGLMFVIALGAVGFNFWGLKVLRSVQGDTLNGRAAYLHVMGDLLSSVAAAIGAVLMALTGWRWVDPTLTCAFAAVIAVSSIQLLVDTGKLWRQETPQP